MELDNSVSFLGNIVTPLKRGVIPTLATKQCNSHGRISFQDRCLCSAADESVVPKHTVMGRKTSVRGNRDGLQMTVLGTEC